MDNRKDEWTKAGFNIFETKKRNEILEFLRSNAPSVFDGNEININELKRILDMQVSDKEYGYGLNFLGKHSLALKNYTRDTTKDVKVEFKQSKNFDSTGNMIFRDDNLDVLKILKNYYTNKIKMIYIDPPYNTKSDEFVYLDNFKNDEEKIINELNIDKEEENRLLGRLKTKGDHNGWLCFMYPRLKLARDLLRDDGVIFISIDDNEQANLKLLCDEVFGEENVDVMIWRKSGSGRDGKMKNTTTFRKDHEYIIVAFKKINILNKSYERPNWENKYGNPDNDIRGNYKSGSISKTEEASNPNHKYYYTVYSPIGKEFTRQFEISKEYFIELDKDNRIYWGKNNDSVPSIKIFLDEFRNVTTSSLVDYKDMTTTFASKELSYITKNDIISNAIRPKPVKLIKKLVQIGSIINKCNEDYDIILDFFAGSGTTAQAVMELNKEDGGNRKFILVQLDEEILKDKPAYDFIIENNLMTKRQDNDKKPYISDITIERCNRAGEKILKELDNKNEIDVGYKVFSVTKIIHLFHYTNFF